MTVKKYEIRISKIVNGKEINIGTHYFDNPKEANTFFVKWRPSTRLFVFRVRYLVLTESVEHIRETVSIIKKKKT